jgi:general stress protein 26
MERKGTDASHGPSVVQGSLDELKKLVQEFDTVMLVTSTPEGRLRARPMAVQEPADELTADLWFVSSLDTAKIEEIGQRPEVCVTALRGSGKAYVSISAFARARRDPALVQKLWKPDWKVWWPDGPTDPQITFVELEVERAEYWEPAGGSVRVLYEMVKSLVKGERGDANLPPTKKL